jgi:hypothetical protein
VNPKSFGNFPWIPPWQQISDRGRAAYEHELKLETSPGHPLHGVPATAIGRTMHDDNILFQLHGHAAALAVVHLTFRGRPEREVKWPHVTLYRHLDHWIMRGMLIDAADYEIDESNQAA